MKRIRYASGSFVTGDRIADAVLDYAAALARGHTGDRVSVPGLGSDDRPTTYDIIIGPASQLLVEDEDTFVDDIGDEAFVADLHERAERLAASD